MASGCKSSLGCIDARVPVRATYVNLYKWPESDAEFLKSVAAVRKAVEHQRGRAHHNTNVHSSSKNHNVTLDGGKKHHHFCNPNTHIVDSYSCRQMFLRSYTFTKEETVQEKTMKCFGHLKDKAADIPFIIHKSKGNGGNNRNNNSNVDNHSTAQPKKNKDVKKRKSKNKKKGCSVTAKKLREMSHSACDFIFHRLLSCTSSVDVVD